MTPSPRSQEYQTIENGPTFATFEFSDSTGAIKNIRGRKVPKYPLDQRRSSSKLFQAMREGEKQPYCASINRISPSVVLAPWRPLRPWPTRSHRLASRYLALRRPE